MKLKGDWMKKIVVQRLGMILTEACNMECMHCLRGIKNSKKMSTEVINATLNQIAYIGNLCICGGEPLLALDVLENIFNGIIKRKIILGEVTLTINGTICDEEFFRLLREIENYITSYSELRNNITFIISNDLYHQEERKRLNLEKIFLENLKRYRESKYFLGLVSLKPNSKLFREGNAKTLDESLTTPLKPMEYFITYVGKRKRLDLENGLCNIGPLVAVNQNGIVTECDASFDHQETLYNYGNVLNEDIEQIALSRGKILTPRKWYRETGKIMKKYTIN